MHHFPPPDILIKKFEAPNIAVKTPKLKHDLLLQSLRIGSDLRNLLMGSVWFHRVDERPGDSLLELRPPPHTFGAVEPPWPLHCKFSLLACRDGLSCMFSHVRPFEAPW